MTKSKTTTGTVITASGTATEATTPGTTIIVIIGRDMEMILDMTTSAINRISALFVAKGCIFGLIRKASLINRDHLLVFCPDFALWFSSYQY